MPRTFLPSDFFDHATRLPAISTLAQQVEGETAAEQLHSTGYRVLEEEMALVGSGLPIESHKAITVQMNGASEVVAVVSKGYGTLFPEDDAEVCDRYIGMKPDTICLIGRGKGVCISYALDKFAVKGDQGQYYLLYVSPKTGQGAVSIRITPVRTICSNSLAISNRHAVENYRFVHDANVKERVGIWLGHIMETMSLRRRLLHDQFNALADTRVPDDLARRILADVYPEPPAPLRDGPKEEVEERIRSWEQRRHITEERRTTAMNLYQGQGTGIEHPACKGTAWGLLAAVTELSDFSRSHNARTRGESALFGQRAADKAKTFDLLLDLASSL